MNQELEALLAVQRDDEAIRAIQSRRDAIGPRLAALDQARKRAGEELSRFALALERERAQHRDLERQIAEHRERHEKQLEVLNQAHKVREATAAMSQVESARKLVAEEEGTLLAMSRRVTELRTATTAATDALAALETEQAEMRARLVTERSAIEQELGEATAQRSRSATEVPAPLLSRYERVHSRKRDTAVFPLHADFSCGSCETALPKQQRPALAGGNRIDVCEACGVLVYLPVAPPHA